jgi:hypothetical protein
MPVSAHGHLRNFAWAQQSGRFQGLVKSGHQTAGRIGWVGRE